MKDTTKNKYPFLLLFASIWLCLIPAFRSDDLNEIRDIDVNGVNIVYQVQGNEDDKPVILLHGNSGEHDHLSVMVNQLDSAGYLVYALDSRGQGANAPLDEYHYVDMANDLYEFIEKLDLYHPLSLDGATAETSPCRWKCYTLRQPELSSQLEPTSTQKE